MLAPSDAPDASTLSPADAAAMVAATVTALRGADLQQSDLQWVLPLLGHTHNHTNQQAGSSSSDRSHSQAQQQPQQQQPEHRKRQLSEAGDSMAVPRSDSTAQQHHDQEQSLAALSPAALLAAASAACAHGSNKKPRHQQAPLSNGAVPSAAKTRFTWAPALHAAFIAAVEQLGGAEAAKPADILGLMPPVPGLTGLTIKSHLQKYRQATREQRLLLLAAQQQQQLQPDAAVAAAAQAGMMQLLAAQAAAAADAAAATAPIAASQQLWLPHQPDAAAQHHSSSCQAPADLSSLQLLCDMAVLEAGSLEQQEQETPARTQQQVWPAEEPAFGFPAGGFGAVLPAVLAVAHRRRSSSSSDAADGSWVPPPAAAAPPPARGLPVSFCQLAPGLPAAAADTAAGAAGPPSLPGVPRTAVGAAAAPGHSHPAAAAGGGPSPPAAPTAAADASLLSSHTAAFLHAVMQPLDPRNRACLAAVLQLMTLQGVITWHEPPEARPCGPPPGLTALLQRYMAEAAAAAAAEAGTAAAAATQASAPPAAPQLQQLQQLHRQ